MDLISFQKNRTFTLEDARELLPVVRSVTNRAARQVEALVQQIENLPTGDDTELSRRLEEEISEIYIAWQGKVERLGAIPVQMWVVDFDFGGGYFSWKFPETDITHWHDYNHGHVARKPIDVWDRKAVSARD